MHQSLRPLISVSEDERIEREQTREREIGRKDIDFRCMHACVIFFDTDVDECFILLALHR